MQKKKVKINGEEVISLFKKVNGCEVLSPFRSLKHYKELHEKAAREKKKGEAFQAARTLTEARKILFG